MGVGELHEIEVFLRGALAEARAAGKAGGEHGAAAQGGQFQELPAIDGHARSSGGVYLLYRRGRADIPRIMRIRRE